MNENKTIAIMTQYFYGNRVATEIKLKNMDKFVLGWTGDEFDIEELEKLGEKIDRSIIKIPNTNIVIIYNKYKEQERLETKKRVGDKVHASAIIPELGITLYSRCIACRIENEEYYSLKDEDYNIVNKYFTA